VHIDWKHLAINVAVILVVVALAESGNLSFIPGMPPKKG
jgi:hypothetical protein